jgi:uncharacterized protein
MPAMTRSHSLFTDTLPRSRIYAPVVLILMIFLSKPGYAVPVQGLYQEEIAVSNQGEQERRRAYTEAFSRVITKVTGERRWLQHPQVATAMRGADRFVAEVSYRSSGVAGQQSGILDVRFDQSLIDNLLNQANIPVWDNNRASVLLWLTIQDTDGRRVMLGSSAEHALLDQVRQFADERAVPVLIPILDLQDRQLVTPDQAWALDPDALRLAAGRYAADSVLAGRVLITPEGELVGFWQLIFRDDVQAFDHVAAVGTYMDVPLDRASARLASHFGLVLSAFDREDQVSIRVDGINNLQSHTQLISYLESLSVVQQVQVSALRPQGLDLNLRLLGTRQILTEFISLGRDLQPVNFQPGQPVNGQLHYRWTR